MTNETTQRVKTVRDHFAAVRTMKRNLRQGRYQGRNNGGDYTYRQRQAFDELAKLPRDLQGALTAEDGLAERLSVARDEGQDRPELRQRLSAVRRDIRAQLTN